MSLTVGIDASAAAGPRLSGVGYHIIALVRAMAPLCAAGERLVAFYEGGEGRSGEMLRERLGSTVEVVRVPFFSTSLGTLHRLKSRYVWPWTVSREGCHLFHGVAHVLPERLPCPSVVTLHDLAFFELELYDHAYATALRASVARSVASASAIICLSDATRSDMRRFLADHREACVIYGAGNYPTEMESTRKVEDLEYLAARFGVHDRYLLYVGDFVVRKNIPYLLAAFAHYVRDTGDERTQLVLAGDEGAGAEGIASEAARLGVAERLVLTGRLCDEDLPVVYRNARAFTLPSLREGFGMVNLEAMAYGLPVVSTDTGAIAEAVGDAGLLVPLEAPAEYARAIGRALDDESERCRLIALGFERSASFTWRVAAERTLALYRRTLGRLGDGRGGSSDGEPAVSAAVSGRDTESP